jgi:3-deoxy-D-manno-octulosonic-acid transferase
MQDAAAEVSAWIAKPAERHAASTAALAFADRHRGATARTVAALGQLAGKPLQAVPDA